MAQRVVFTESLKGGTGKTTISANIANELSKDHDVILIDADLDSPNLPRMFGMKDGMDMTIDGFIPAKYGERLNLFSMGLLAKDRAISMDGAGYVQLLNDVLNHTDWDVDRSDCYVVIDLPAGAADIFRTLVKYFAKDLVGTVLVTIPRESDDLDRVIKLNNHFAVPILGVIENMAAHVCETCGEITNPFGIPNAEGRVKGQDFEFFGGIPLARSIQENIDAGNPFLPEQYNEPIHAAVEAILAAEPAGPKILSRLRSKVKVGVSRALAGLFREAIIRTNKEVDIKNMQEEHGFGGRVFEICVTDDNQKALFELYLIVKGGTLKVVRHAKNTDTVIYMPVDILRRVTKRDIDLAEAYYAGDVQIYGDGAAVRALMFFEKVWGTIEDDASRSIEFMGDEIEGDE